MNWVLIIVGVIIYLGIIGLFVDVQLNFNVSKNSGLIIIKVFKITIIRFNLKIEGNSINFTKQKKKKTKNLIVNTTNLQFIEELKRNLVKSIYLNNLEIDCFILLTRPDLAALSVGVVNIILNIIRIKVLDFQNDVNISLNTVSGFENNELAVLIDLSLVISLIDLIWAILVTIFRRRRLYGKKHRQFNN